MRRLLLLCCLLFAACSNVNELNDLRFVSRERQPDLRDCQRERIAVALLINHDRIGSDNWRIPTGRFANAVLKIMQKGFAAPPRLVSHQQVIAPEVWFYVDDDTTREDKER